VFIITNALTGNATGEGNEIKVPKGQDTIHLSVLSIMYLGWVSDMEIYLLSGDRTRRKSYCKVFVLTA